MNNMFVEFPTNENWIKIRVIVVHVVIDVDEQI